MHVHDMHSCSNGMCGSCPSCLVAQGYMMPNVAVIDPAVDMVGKYSYADLMIELHINK